MTKFKLPIFIYVIYDQIQVANLHYVILQN